MGSLEPTGPRPRLRVGGVTTSPCVAALAASLVPLLASACGEAGPGSEAWEASVDTVADTVVVRTLAGMEWPDTMQLVPEVVIGVLDGAEEYIFGQIASLAVDDRGRIWAVDRQVPELRVFDAEGRYLMTVGRPGEGPGELKGPDGGLAVLSDGRVLVRDPSNARIQVYGPEGEPLDTWIVRGNFSTSNPLWMDRRDNVYTQVLLDPEASLSEWRIGLARIGPDGTSTDTLEVPDAGYEEPFIEARTENSWSRNGVPFAAGEHWALHPDGYFVHGIGDEYGFTLLKDPERDGSLPLRIERRYAPVPVQRAEAAEERRRATQNMRSMIPDWTWNGPSIPETKPAFEDILVGRDGRIWVRVSTPGYRREDPDYDPTDPDAVPDEWREAVAFDVFEPDGTYLGHVKAPDTLSPYPAPVLDGPHVWAVTRDELGVNRIVRFRLEPLEGP